MPKIYVLLRNNQQTGPYDLNELLQFDLKPYDLIWIQGKSAGWYYPQEIQALHPHLPFVKKTTQQVKAATPQPAKPVENIPTTPFIAMPSNIFTKEEPLQPAYFNEPKRSSPEPDALEAAVYQYKKIPTEKTSYTPPKKTKKQPVFSSTGVGIACLLVGVLGWFIAKPFLMDSSAEIQPEQMASAPAENEINANNTASSSVVQSNTSSLKKQRQQKDLTVVKKITSVTKGSTNSTKEVVVSQAPVEITSNETEPVNKEERSTVDEKKNQPIVTEAPKEEKKKLRDKIFDIFKKKPQDAKKEEANPAEENGERRSTRRDVNLTQSVSVRFAIPNDWMIGVKGAKATLANRSNETIAKATIEVLYYNDDNELLDKKIISFGKVEAKSSQTVSIPDHATATKVDYNVISVTGAGQPVAKL